MKISHFRSRPDWLEARRKMIGASDVAGILGVGYADQNALTVFESKISPIDYDPSDPTPDNFILGQTLEPGIMEAVNRKYGKLEDIDIAPATASGDLFEIIQHDEFPIFGCTPDGWESGTYPVEAKNVRSSFASDWADGDSPVKFQIQVQFQLLCTGASRGLLVAAIGTDRIERRWIERDNEFLDALIVNLQEFWEHVVNRVPPPIDGSETSRRALQNLYANERNTSIIFPAVATSLREIREAAAAQEKHFGKIKTEAENHLKAMMGECVFGLLPDGSAAKWKEVVRAEKACACGAVITKESKSRRFSFTKNVPENLDYESIANEQAVEYAESAAGDYGNLHAVGPHRPDGTDRVDGEAVPC